MNFTAGTLILEGVINLLPNTLKSYAKIITFLRAQCQKFPPVSFFCEKEGDGSESSGQQCISYTPDLDYKMFVTSDDIDIIMERLSLVTDGKELQMWRGDHEHSQDVMSLLLEEKEASLEEMKGAFSVFDVNGDGFISANELQSVMRKLELREGMELDDCEKMIDAFDKNGDGLVDLFEFRNMLETTV